MTPELLSEIDSRVDDLINNNFLSGKYVVVFGMNHPGDYIIRRLRDKRVPVNIVIDNNLKNVGLVFEGIPVTFPEAALSVFNSDAAVLICSRYYAEMRRQLERMGYIMDVHIFKILDMGSEAVFSLDVCTFKEKAEAALEGANLADKILSDFSADSLLVCPVKANGDVYIACSFLKAYLVENKIEKYVLTVMGNTCAKVAELFGFNSVYVSNQDEINRLTAGFRMLADSKRLMILQPFWNYSSFINRLDCYKGLNFYDYYKHWVFGLDDNIRQEKPANKSNHQYVKELFQKNGLSKGKTVILSPYANSLSGINMELFEMLAAELNDKGFCTATNVAGEETPVKGTQPLTFPISEIISVAEYAGLFISIRNGICDILSSVSCVKVIIYPQKAYGFGTAKELYSISGMSDVPVLEVIYEGDVKKCISGIIDYISESEPVE